MTLKLRREKWNQRSKHYVPCGCYAVLLECDPRAQIWRYALGCLKFPLQNPISHVESAQGERSAYFLKGDWNALSEKQKDRMFQALKLKFNVERSEFFSQIKTVGYMPIKDENITVVICEIHTRCMQ